jgi:hypothetical protein
MSQRALVTNLNPILDRHAIINAFDMMGVDLGR